MTVFLPILVCLCGGVGASCRYLLDVTIKTYCSNQYFATAINSGVLGHSFQPPKGR